MWSHYSNNHKGFVVGLKSKALDFKHEYTQSDDIPEYESWEEDLVCFKIEYSDMRPKLKFGEKRNTNSSVNLKHLATYCTKYTDWNYEKEHRCISINKGAGIHPYKSELIKEVIVGVNADRTDIDTMKRLIKNKNQGRSHKIKLYLARMEKGKYAISLDELQV